MSTHNFFFQLFLPGAVLAPIAAVSIFASAAISQMLAKQAAGDVWVYLASQPFFTCALIFGGLAMVSAFGHSYDGGRGFMAFVATCAWGIGGMAIAQYAVPAIAASAGAALSPQNMEIALITTYSIALLLASITSALLYKNPLEVERVT